ncbi:hypothetical protein [Streptomyces showdoensis]|uniref:ABM domain-containing protein n=1 Tax=Streptomyces showdoensis TaxID=68268 RepID=A0A2P2GT12_STREW|nr:hypothetical protein [Streptomyces showdoensis]KKZ74621.1 hypothetical protein VO63_05875 [Streptomyces showdoensis]
MAVIVTIEVPGLTQEVYERATAALVAAPWWPARGFLAHAAGPDGSGGWRVVDFWESEEDFRAFVEQARPIFVEHGMPPLMPRIDPAVKVMTR